MLIVQHKLNKWQDYEDFGTPVLPSKFIPMKTPLSRNILNNIGAAPSHTVTSFLDQQRRLGRHVGLIIDLTNHDCIYEEERPDHVQHVQIRCTAKVYPARSELDQVISLATSFWKKNPEQYIAIHCSYGFNRTGFIVSSYLVEVCGLTIDDAVQAFARARKPGIKHDNFRQELFRIYAARRCPAQQALCGVETHSLPSRSQSCSVLCSCSEQDTGPLLETCERGHARYDSCGGESLTEETSSADGGPGIGGGSDGGSPCSTRDTYGHHEFHAADVSGSLGRRVFDHGTPGRLQRRPSLQGTAGFSERAGSQDVGANAAADFGRAGVAFGGSSLQPCVDNGFAGCDVVGYAPRPPLCLGQFSRPPAVAAVALNCSV
eukprot:jgi/Mesvir1/7025/Mv09153-RA.1